MGKKRAAKRFNKIWEKFTHFRKAIIWLGGAMLTAIVGTAIDRYFGSPVVNYIESFYSKYISLTLKDVFLWVINHPVGTTAIFCLLVITIIFVSIYFETRDPSGIFLEKIGKGEYAKSIVIHNESGNHLSDYIAWITSINQEDCMYQIAPVFLQRYEFIERGKPRPSREKPEFRNATTLELQLSPVPEHIAITNKFDGYVQTVGTHDVELKFQAFDKNNNLVELIIYSVIEIRKIVNDEKHVDIFIKEVST